MTITRDHVLQALATVPVPPGGANLVASGRLSEVVVEPAARVMFSIAVEPAEASAMEAVRQAAEAAVKGLPGVKGVFASLTADRPAAKAPATTPQPTPGRPQSAPSPKAQALPGVKHVIAVASGKGGVGKSTTACNLALGLQAVGLRVGLLDADIYGPSMPQLFGLTRQARSRSTAASWSRWTRYGLKVMSIGFLVDEETPMIWRGPMVMSALHADAARGRLGRARRAGRRHAARHRRRAAHAGAAGAARRRGDRLDAAGPRADRRAARASQMFQKVDVPVLGIVENMSYFVCPHCGSRHDDLRPRRRARTRPSGSACRSSARCR